MPFHYSTSQDQNVIYINPSRIHKNIQLQNHTIIFIPSFIILPFILNCFVLCVKHILQTIKSYFTIVSSKIKKSITLPNSILTIDISIALYLPINRYLGWKDCWSCNHHLARLLKPFSIEVALPNGIILWYHSFETIAYNQIWFISIPWLAKCTKK